MFNRNKLYHLIKKGDIKGLVKLLYNENPNTDDFNVCFHFLEDNLQNDFILELCKSEHFNHTNFLTFLRSVNDIDISKEILENININILDCVKYKIVKILSEKKYNSLILYFFERITNNLNIDQEDFFESIYKIIIEHANIELAIEFKEKYDLHIRFFDIMIYDLDELLDLNTTQKDKLLGELNFFIESLILNRSFKCFLKILNAKILERDDINKIRSKFINDYLLLIDKNTYNFVKMENFQEKIKYLIKILNYFQLKISDFINHKNLVKIIIPKLKKESGSIPIELIIRELHLFYDVDWEEYDYNNLYKVAKPLWKDFWIQKIKNDFPKDRINYFIEDIVYNENTKFVYTQIQQSIDYDLNSENYQRAKEDFEEKSEEKN